MFSNEVVWFMNDVGFYYSFEYISRRYSMMILLGFNIICDMLCGPIKDAFLKDAKKHLRKSVIFSKDVDLK